jgi:hypothetical protein
MSLVCIISNTSPQTDLEDSILGHIKKKGEAETHNFTALISRER